ncbi:MAG: electron transfer flavoprotein-ubiquinone oxidoreductase [Alphaproteobacteria bacterium]
MQREEMTYDLLIIGGGPAGLAAAIRFRQQCLAEGKDYTVCLVEKGAEIGAHSLSGAVFNPIALQELFPDWQQQGAPLTVKVTEDHFCYLTQQHSLSLPVPPPMHNQGNYIISLGALTQWLGKQAEALGVEIYAGIAAASPFYDEKGALAGVITGDMGVDKEGQHSAQYVAGMILKAKQVILAEGCRGHLSQQIIRHFQLAENRAPQTYGLGIKEIWQIKPEHHQQGKVVHTIGWPLNGRTYGGSWLYHQADSQISIGFVVGLDYHNPTLSPFQEMQRFKHHPAIKPLLEGGKRLSYGARALVEGGYQSLPRLSFPGGVLIGDAAGFLLVPQIKGNHTAMKSGMVAAEAIFKHFANEATNSECVSYETNLRASWVFEELYKARNIRPAFRFGLWPALALSAIDHYIFKGKAPWTLRHGKPDHLATATKNKYPAINYPKPDGVISFDRLSSLYLSNTVHEENQPCHLRLHKPEQAIDLNWQQYGSPEQYYCPAQVYEVVDDAATGTKKLQINAANCLHCKSCDIKDPAQNILWTPPEGGGGPNYISM